MSRWTAILLLMLCLLAGCSKPARRPPIDRVDVVATVYPLAQVAQAVGGPVVNVRWLVESGQSLGGVAGAERRGLQTARLVLFNSGVTEPWVGGDAPMSLGGERLLRLDLLPGSRTQNPAGSLWLDPVVVREAAVELRNRLLALRPKQQAILTDRTDAFCAELDGLIASTQARFAPLAGQVVLTLGHEFDPLLARLRLEPTLPLERDVMALSDADLRYLRGTLAAKPCRSLIVSLETPPGTRERLAVLGLPVVAIDTLGSSGDLEREMYTRLMKSNLDALARGLRVE